MKKVEEWLVELLDAVFCGYVSYYALIQLCSFVFILFLSHSLLNFFFCFMVFLIFLGLSLDSSDMLFSYLRFFLMLCENGYLGFSVIFEILSSKKAKVILG